MPLNEDFQQAVAESKSLSSRPDNNTLLRLYSLYKQATEGDCKGEAPTGMFDFVGKAKHEAWASLKGQSAEVAMEQYIILVQKLKQSS